MHSFHNLKEETDVGFIKNGCVFDGAVCNDCEKLVVSKHCSKASSSTNTTQITNKNHY